MSQVRRISLPEGHIRTERPDAFAIRLLNDRRQAILMQVAPSSRLTGSKASLGATGRTNPQTVENVFADLGERSDPARAALARARARIKARLPYTGEPGPQNLFVEGTDDVAVPETFTLPPRPLETARAQIALYHQERQAHEKGTSTPTHGQVGRMVAGLVFGAIAIYAYIGGTIA